MSNKFKNIIIICGIIVIAAALIIHFSTAKDHNHSLTISLPQTPNIGLILLAQKKGLFQAHQLNLRLDYKDTGKEALETLYAGKSDLAIAFETPIALGIATRKNIKIITELHRSFRNTALLYRTDRFEPNSLGMIDLRGKRVGVIEDTNAEFFLNLYLMASSHKNKANIIYLTSDSLKEQMRNGQLDALAWWEPHLSELYAQSDGKLEYSKTEFYTELSALVCLEQTCQNKKAAILKLMRALKEAELFLEQQPDTGHKLILSYFSDNNLNSDHFNLSEIYLQLGLSSVLTSILEIQLGWFQQKKINAQATSIDLIPYYEPYFLNKVAPLTVTFE
ncbi:MAG: hypothetical protein CME62_00330 [Halobacteriovoraceae bacterium]|nr:hypothetical protein [Halobacteriovoraceae bacterium]|tara:strand:+ start:7318 stop:8319 length:1002 start_codon:yes stop_codon:yes gene_type:complete